jgi:hypothetical protein
MPTIVETPGTKSVFLHANQDHIVVTSDGVIVEHSAGGLGTDDTLDLLAISEAEAPQPLPGTAAAPLRWLTLASGQTTLDAVVTLWFPYADINHDGQVDNVDPALGEELLTLWYYSPDQEVWVHLPEAVILIDANMVRVQTAQLGLFAILRASDGRVGSVGTSDEYQVQGVRPGMPTDSPIPMYGWQTIGTASVMPFAVAWDTTAFADGDYEIRAVCASDASQLEAFQTAAAVVDGSGSSNCFIATAAYGSAMEPRVQLLRSFRDAYLVSNSAGRWLVAQYYRFSPPIADIIRHHETLRAVVRLLLAPMLGIVYILMHGSLATSSMFFVCVAAMGICAGWGFKRLWTRA